MSEILGLNMFDPNSWLAEHVMLAATSPDMDQMAPAHLRPVFDLVVRTHAALGKRPTEINVLANWQQIAILAGQARAARGMLPTNLQDQWDSIEREVFTESARVADTGRPE